MAHKTIITAQGLAAFTAATLGEQLLFTKAKIGQGEPEDGQSLSTLTGLIEPIDTLPIVKLTRGVSDNTAIVGFIFDNNDRADGFYYRETGIFAHTETTGEVLFAYVNSEDNAEYIPAGGGQVAIERPIDIVFSLDNTVEVSALIDSTAYATREDVEAAMAAAQSALDAAAAAMAFAESITCPPEGCAALQALIARVARLESAFYDNMDSNPFGLTFATLDGKTVTAGNWNKAQARLEC